MTLNNGKLLKYILLIMLKLKFTKNKMLPLISTLLQYSLHLFQLFPKILYFQIIIIQILKPKIQPNLFKILLKSIQIKREDYSQYHQPLHY